MKIAICDDVKNLREYYEKLFSGVENVEVVGTAGDGGECIALVRRTRPDVLLLDIQMRSNDEGIEIIEDLLSIIPELRIIMLTAHKVDDYVFRAFALGAKDFVYKTAGDDEVIAKVLDVYNNNVMLSSEVADILTRKTRAVMNMQKSILYMINQITRLSPSEINVLRGVYYGKSYKDIAHERFVEEGTVRAQASGILKKFEVKSMKALIKNLKDMELFEFIDLQDKN